MKKILSVLLVGLLGIVLYMPHASAAEVVFNCEKKCDLSSDDQCVSTCTFGITGNTTALATFNAVVELSPESVQMGEVKLNAGWENKGTGTTLNLVNTNPEGVSDADITFGTFTVTMPRDLQGASCKITLKPTGMTTVEQVIEVEQIPSTGATLPLIVLGCGAAVAVGAYYVTRKNTKMYKI